ncbi:hypothetical protein [Azospirillum doebereinerae]|nr:hypothetical protein [Azospirillum doebereinerae]
MLPLDDLATGDGGMEGTAEMARRELAAFGDLLFQAERDVGRFSPAALMVRLLRVAALFPQAVDDTLMWQVTDLVAGREVGDRFKLVVIRMGWASLVQAEFKARGLRVVGQDTELRAKAA